MSGRFSLLLLTLTAALFARGDAQACNSVPLSGCQLDLFFIVLPCTSLMQDGSINAGGSPQACALNAAGARTSCEITFSPTDCDTFINRCCSPGTNFPSTTPTQAPTTREPTTETPTTSPTLFPTAAPSTPRPSTSPTTSQPTESPQTPIPTRSPSTAFPTQAPNGGAAAGPIWSVVAAVLGLHGVVNIVRV